MIKRTLPRNKEGYVGKGVYCLPKEKRKAAFEALIKSEKSDVSAEYRLNALKKMRGDL